MTATSREQHVPDGGDKRSQPPTRLRMRKLGGVLAVVVGVLLILLERSAALGSDQPGAAWFWILVALFLIALGIAQLLDRGGPGRVGR